MKEQCWDGNKPQVETQRTAPNTPIKDTRNYLFDLAKEKQRERDQLRTKPLKITSG